MNDRLPGKARLSIFVSLRYGSVDLIERALSRVLRRKGYDVFLHNLTADPLGRMSSPIVFEGCGLQFATHESITRQPHPYPSEFSPDLFLKLVRSIGTQDVAIILWTQTYRQGFWSRLELNTTLAIAKPLVLVQVDYEPLVEPLLAAARSGKVAGIALDTGFLSKRVVAGMERAVALHSSP